MDASYTTTAIIVTWNSKKVIEHCIESLASAIHQDIRVVVVDNGSSDGTAVFVEQRFPFVTLIGNQQNLLLSRALNMAIHDIPAAFYLIINPDVVISPEVISLLRLQMEADERIGIIAPKLVYPNGTLQYSARRFPTLFTVLFRGLGFTEGKKNLPHFLRHHLLMDTEYNSTKSVDWVLGACMLVRRSVFDTIGLYRDRLFPLYYNDVDLCWRAHRAGFKTVYFPHVSAVHDYARESARGGLFNVLKWSHFVSALRFLVKKNFSRS